ncbi:MAG: hypothetical protein IJW85_01505 [Clostridia bacterium]|nr:hypothetical protein [Clostridia bacterium]
MFDIPVSEQIAIAREIFPDIQEIGNGICQATCPGIDCHSTGNGPRDFRIWFEAGKGPHDNCVHKSCAAARDAAMQALYSALRRKDPARAANERRYNANRAAYAAAPTIRKAPADPYDETEAAAAAAQCPVLVDDAWLLAHSPVPVPADPLAWPRLLLDSIYEPGERILVFTKFASQGQVLHTCKGPTVRLEEHPPAFGTTPHHPPTAFPKGGQNGCWFLAAPITGKWQPNDNNRDKYGAKLGRRHAACATRFPFLVLESDEAPPSVWLRILVQLADPIVAVYTSGGKSYHALVRVNCATKEDFDVQRQIYITRLAALGADPAAITAVRLTRLPGCLRYGSGEGKDHRPYKDHTGQPAPRMQKLLYLNPAADSRSILQLASCQTPRNK